MDGGREIVFHAGAANIFRGGQAKGREHRSIWHEDWEQREMRGGKKGWCEGVIIRRIDMITDSNVNMDNYSFKEGVNQFSPSLILLHIGGPLLILFALPLFVLNAIMIFGGILVESTQLSLENLIGIAIGVFGPKVIVQGIGSHINSSSIIRVVENGLVVRTFNLGFTWEFVPWEEVIEVIPSPRVLHNGLLQWVIQINTLQDTHSDIGKLYGNGTSPAILLSVHYKNRDKLIDIINEKIRDGKITRSESI